MAIRQKLDGVPCVQFELAVGNKQRRCVYCSAVVKKPRSVRHECKSKISILMSNYVRLCVGETVEERFKHGKKD